jgi:protein-tyrosine-phosphatase
MNLEENGLAARAARYAALADPVRLRIVDLLTLGDLAPIELQSELGISSSLLAHHLNLLEREGMLLRSRSEADRRRTYLHLAPGAFDGLTPSPALGVRRVVFVCTGNSARSQLAEALWHDASDVPVASAGTQPAEAIEPGAIAAAERHELTLLASAPRSVDAVLDADDYVITVCDTAHEQLGGADRLHWSIPDPVRDGTDAAFDAAFEDLAARIRGIAPHLSAAG